MRPFYTRMEARSPDEQHRAGTTYDSSDGAGTFAIEEGGLSGSLDITLTSAEDGSTVNVAGEFTCEDLS